MMVSKLTDVSIYTKDESEPLVTVLKAIETQYGDALPVSKKSKNDELMDFLYSVLPELDEERVYPSNVKKLLGWYKILRDFEVNLDWSPETAEATEGEAVEEAASETTETES